MPTRSILARNPWSISRCNVRRVGGNHLGHSSFRAESWPAVVTCSPSQNEWREMEHAWVTRAIVAERKLCALQASHEELVKALSNLVSRPGLAENYDAARTALDNAAKLAPTK